MLAQSDSLTSAVYHEPEDGLTVKSITGSSSAGTVSSSSHVMASGVSTSCYGKMNINTALSPSNSVL